MLLTILKPILSPFWKTGKLITQEYLNYKKDGGLF